MRRFYSIPEDDQQRISKSSARHAIRILQCAEEYSFLINLRTQKIAFAVLPNVYVENSTHWSGVCTNVMYSYLTKLGTYSCSAPCTDRKVLIYNGC